MDYDQIAKSYNELYNEEQLEKLNIIKKYIKVKKSDKLLDIGCGTGISTNFFDCDSIGIDPSKELLKLGKGRLIFGKAENLPFDSNIFDVILVITSIHNFDNFEKAIKEILKVKKHKSTIVITILKKSKNYNKIKQAITKYFKTKEIDSPNDMIFISK